MKVIIQDLVAKYEGKPEQELPADTRIRFVVGENNYIVKCTPTGIEVHKVNTESDDKIKVLPQFSNQIEIQ